MAFEKIDIAKALASENKDNPQVKINAHKKSPGFFTPYKNSLEFAQDLTNAVLAPPLAIASLSTRLASTAVSSVSGDAAKGLASNGSPRFFTPYTNSSELAQDLAAVVRAPLAAVSLSTRSVFTGVSNCISHCYPKSEEELNGVSLNP